MELTTDDITKIFCVTVMTVYNWRKGIDKKKTTKLPYHTQKVGARHKVYFKWGEVKQWATQNEVAVCVHPKDLGATSKTKRLRVVH